MSDQKSGDKGGEKKKDRKRRIVIQLPAGSPLGTMSQDEIDKHIHALIGKAGIDKAGIDNRQVGPVEELLIEIADSSSPTALAPGDGWAARWSRKCAI